VVSPTIVHRPVREEWVVELQERCVDEGVAFFFKQWGGRHSKANGRTLRGREWSEMPTPRSRELLAAI
jgi:protein gp37